MAHNSRNTPAIIIALFFVIGFVIYGHSVWVNQFVEFDDTLLIIDNLSVIQAGRLSSVLWAFGYYDPELYIPLTFLSFQFDAVIAGLSPFMFHLDNLFEHIFNALLVTWILRLLFRRTDVALILGMLFLVHPLNTEAVAWASGRKDLLSTMFALLSMVTYLEYQSRVQKGQGARKWSTASVGTFLLSVLAKVSVAPVPVTFFLLDWFQGRSIGIKSMWEKKLYFVFAILLGIIALLGKEEVLARSSPFSIIMLIPRSITFYAQKFLFPINLSVLYPYPDELISIGNPAIILSAFLCTAAAICIWLLRKQYPALFVGSLIALLMLVPSFFQYYRGYELYLATDRYMYAPFIGVCIMIVPVLRYFIDRNRQVTYGVTCAILCIFAFLSFQRAKVWENTYTLFSNALESSESFGAYEKVGAWLLREGDREGAIQALKRSIELAPNSAAYFRLGVAAMEVGNIADAKIFTEEALRLSPKDPQSHINMSKFYWDDGNIAKALEHAELAVKYHPWHMMALGNLATIYTLTFQKEQAWEVIDTILDLEPKNERVRPLLKKLGVE